MSKNILKELQRQARRSNTPLNELTVDRNCKFENLRADVPEIYNSDG